MQKRHLLGFILTLVAATGASAAGYQLQEYSVTNLGRAFAGVGVMGDDYSAVAFNPAGMSLMNNSGVQMGAIAVDVYGSARGSSKPTGMSDPKSDKIHSNIFRLLPHFYGQKKVNDKLDLGIGLYVPFGLANDYDNDWFGVEHGEYSGITVVDLTPSISYKILDTLSVGAGINLQYTVAHLTGGVVGGGHTNMHDADDMGVGYNVGLTWQPQKSTRLGVSYRSKVDHKLQGKNDMVSALRPALNGRHDVSAKITTPETVIFSAAQDLNNKWTLSGIARFTRWTRFNVLNIYQDEKPMSSTHEKWKNTWYFGAGVDYKYCKNLTFRFGTAWDNTAIRSVKYRTARIPDERRIWASIGATYTKDNWQFDIGYSHLFVHNAKAKGTTEEMRERYHGSFDAKYRIQSNIFGMGLQYKF